MNRPHPDAAPEPASDGGRTPFPKPSQRSPLQRRGRRSRDRIVAAAWELIDRHGPRDSAVSVRAIATAAEVSTGALYHHFEDLDRILGAVAERFMDELVSAINAVHDGVSWSGWDAMLDAMIGAYVDVFGRHPGLRELWFDNRASPDVTSVHQHYRHRIAEDARNQFLLVTGRDLPLITHQVVIALSGSLFELAFRADPSGDAVVIEELRQVMRAFYARHLSPGRAGPAISSAGPAAVTAPAAPSRSVR